MYDWVLSVLIFQLPANRNGPGSDYVYRTCSPEEQKNSCPVYLLGQKLTILLRCHLNSLPRRPWAGNALFAVY